MSEITDIILDNFKTEGVLENTPVHDHKFTVFLEEQLDSGYLFGLGEELVFYIQNLGNKNKHKTSDEKERMNKINKSTVFVRDFTTIFSYMSGSKKVTYWDTTYSKQKEDHITSKEMMGILFVPTAGCYDSLLSAVVNRRNKNVKGKVLPNGNKFLTYIASIDTIGMSKAIIDIYGEPIKYEEHVKKNAKR